MKKLLLTLVASFLVLYANAWTVYFTNTDNWSEVAVYTWNGNSKYSGDWPGTKMTYDSNLGLWKFTGSGTPNQIIFNSYINPDANKTGDLDFIDGAVFGKNGGNLYVIGTNVNGNNWVQNTNKMTLTSELVYEWSGNSLSSDFKINDGSWNTPLLNIGGQPGQFIYLNNPYQITRSSESKDIMFDGLVSVTNPKIVLDIKNGTLTLSGKPVYEVPKNLYIVGEVNGNNWDPSKALKMDGENGDFIAENVFIRGNDPNFGYVNFSTSISSNSSDWSGLGTRYGASSYDLSVESCDPLELVIASQPYSFKLGDGYYDIVIKISVNEAPTVSFTQKNMTLSVGSDNTEQSGSVNDATQTIEMVSLNKEVHVFISTYNGKVPYYKVEETGPADSIIIPDDGEQGEEPGMGASKIRAASTIVSDYQEAQIFDYDGNDKGKYFAVLPVGKKGTLSIIFDKDGENIYPTVYNFNVAKDTPTAVEEIDGAEGAEAVYYNLQGTRVYNPERGIFIKVANGKTQKVIL